MIKKERSEYSKSLNEIMELLRYEQARYQKELLESKTDKDKDSWAGHLRDSRFVFDWLQWQQMLINPD
jgi:hypothetical protein